MLISNTRESVLVDFQTLRSGLGKRSQAKFFFNQRRASQAIDNSWRNTESKILLNFMIFCSHFQTSFMVAISLMFTLHKLFMSLSQVHYKGHNTVLNGITEEKNKFSSCSLHFLTIATVHVGFLFVQLTRWNLTMA